MTTLNAILSPAPALVTTVDSTGNLVLQTAGTNAVTYDANQNARHTGSISSVNTFGFKNRIINGAMVIDQRNAGTSVTAGATSAYLLDRWNYNCSQASKVSFQQNAGSITPPVGFTNYLGATSLSAYSVAAGELFTLCQVIEGYNTSDLGWGTANAKTVTLSFQVYSSLTGTFGGCLRNYAGSRSYPFTYTISSANTWTTISVTVAGDTGGTTSWNLGTNTGSIMVWFGLGVGTTLSGTAGSWSANNYVSATGATSVVGTNGATFYITGVQLEVGSSATGYEYVNYQTSLANCQRYYIPIAQYSLAQGRGNGTAGAVSAISIPVSMRATPTMPSSGNASLYSVAGYSASSGVTFYSFILNPNSVGFQTTGFSGGTDNRPNCLEFGSGFYLSAEL